MNAISNVVEFPDQGDPDGWSRGSIFDPNVQATPLAERMACPMHLIAGVKITNIKRGGVIVDRKIEIVLDCSCKYFLSLEPGKRAPRPGEPSHCRGAHGT